MLESEGSLRMSAQRSQLMGDASMKTPPSTSRGRGIGISTGIGRITVALLSTAALPGLLSLMSVSCAMVSRDRARPSRLEAKVGSHVAFNCHIDFPYEYPIPYVVQWSKDSKRIFTWYEGVVFTHELFNGRLNMIDNQAEYGKASLNLTAIRESDQGWYHCQIVFPNRSPNVRNNGTWYHLAVEGGSLIKIPPINQTIMEGQTAFFHCVMKFPESSIVVWYKDGVTLHESQDLLRRSYLGPDGSLSIDPTMMSDLGEYECNVRNNEGDVQTAKAFLNIQYKAKVIYAPPEVFLPYGQSAILDCHFRANPPLKTLRWEKDGLLFDSYNVPGVFYKTNGSLFFSKVDESHGGSYTCTPHNDLGTDGPSPVISVVVLRPPIFSTTPKAIYIQKLGASAVLPCEATDQDGHSAPTIAWRRKDGLDLPQGRFSISGGNLTIDHLMEVDRGMYECSATNEAATITAETELMIENSAPRPPYNLTANSTETTIQIHWQPGHMRPNREYTVWYREVETPEWRTMRILNRTVMEANIENLQPGREYELMVLNQGNEGHGMFSKQIRYATKPRLNIDQDQGVEQIQPQGVTEPLAANLPFPPHNLTALANALGWLLQWEHPGTGYDAAHPFKVSWWKQPDGTLVGSAETWENFYQLPHLKEEATFLVRVHRTMADDNGADVGAEVVIEVPSHRKMRTLVIGSTVGILFLICAMCAFLYLKRSCLRYMLAGGATGQRNKESEKMNNR